MARVSTASMRAAPWWGYTTVSPTLKDIWQVPLPLEAILPRTGSPIKRPWWRICRSVHHFRAYVACSTGNIASRARLSAAALGRAKMLAASTTVSYVAADDISPVYLMILFCSGNHVRANHDSRVGTRAATGSYWKEEDRCSGCGDSRKRCQ